MATLYQKYITGDDANWAFYQTLLWQSQTFTPVIRHNITSVKLKLLRLTGAATPGTLTVSIRKTTAGKPTGDDLCVGTTDGDTITDTSPGEWREITFTTSPTLIENRVYAIIIKSSADDTGNAIAWRADNSSPSYAGGSRVHTQDLGVTWTIFTTTDLMFEEYGNVATIYPSDANTRVTGLVHRWSPGNYTLEVFLGDTHTDWSVSRPEIIEQPVATLTPKPKPQPITPPSTGIGDYPARDFDQQFAEEAGRLPDPDAPSGYIPQIGPPGSIARPIKPAIPTPTQRANIITQLGGKPKIPIFPISSAAQAKIDAARRLLEQQRARQAGRLPDPD